MLDLLKLKNEVSETTDSIEPDDVYNVKSKLKNLGYYKEPDWGMTKFSDNGMFEGIKSFQKDNKLKVDGIMKPQGETESKINNVLNNARKTNPISEVVGLGKSIVDIYKANDKIKQYTRSSPNGYYFNDKNAHALISCSGAQNGKLSRAAIGAAGALRESIQQQTGANTKDESIADMKANIFGWKVGYNNPDKDCNDLVKQKYPQYIKRK